MCKLTIVFQWGVGFPPEDAGRYLQTSLVVTTGRGVVTGLWWVEARDAARCPTVQPQVATVPTVEKPGAWTQSGGSTGARFTLRAVFPLPPPEGEHECAEVTSDLPHGSEFSFTAFLSHWKERPLGRDSCLSCVPVAERVVRRRRPE